VASQYIRNRARRRDLAKPDIRWFCDAHAKANARLAAVSTGHPADRTLSDGLRRVEGRRIVVAGYQQVANLRFESLHAPRWSCPQEVASDAVDHAYIYRQYHQAQIESRGSGEVGSDRPGSLWTTLGSARSSLKARTYQHFR